MPPYPERVRRRTSPAISLSCRPRIHLRPWGPRAACTESVQKSKKMNCHTLPIRYKNESLRDHSRSMISVRLWDILKTRRSSSRCARSGDPCIRLCSSRFAHILLDTADPENLSDLVAMPSHVSCVCPSAMLCLSRVCELGRAATEGASVQRLKDGIELGLPAHRGIAGVQRVRMWYSWVV
jgi:hypothetical protein